MKKILLFMFLFFVSLCLKVYAQDSCEQNDNETIDYQMPDMADTIRAFQDFQMQLDQNLEGLDYEQLYSISEQDMTDMEGMTDLLKSGAQMRQLQKDMIKKMDKAAKDGKVGAQFQLAMIYSAGIADMKESVKLLKKAANNGHRGAQYILGFMYGYGDSVDKNFREASKWLKKAVDQGHKEAKKFLDEINSEVKTK